VDDAQSMSQQSRFLPTISNSLAYSMLQNARSSSLRKKLLRLVTPGRHEPQDSALSGAVPEAGQKYPNINQESKSLAEAISASLWKRMQKKLYDPFAARQLKYFKFGGKDIAKDTMLEEENYCQPCKSALTEADTSFVPLEED